MSNNAPSIPVIVLAFANENTADGYLGSLTREMKALIDLLEEARQDNRCEVRLIPAATQEDIVKVFQDEWYSGRIQLFHYAGHANETALWAEGEDGGNAALFSVGLAKFLGAQTGVKAVFLNACATHTHAQLLLAAGIPAVVATNEKINDEQALQFSTTFYRAVGQGAGLDEAFREAEASLFASLGEIGIHRDDYWQSGTLSWPGKDVTNPCNLPWALFFTNASALHINLFGKKADAFIGQRVENYVIEKFLAQGTMGAVYVARHINLQRRVAIKLVYPVKTGYEKARQLIYEGSSGLGTLRHPNVAEVYDVGETMLFGQQRLFIAMELVPKGRPMHLYPFKWERLQRWQMHHVVGFLLRVCEGLRTAHNTTFEMDGKLEYGGILHGNFRANKVLVTEQQKDVKIIDFMFTNLNQLQGVIVEFPVEVLREEAKFKVSDYLPPEVVDGQTEANKQTDIFSLGAAFFTLLSGKALSEVRFRNPEDLLGHLQVKNNRYPRYLARIIFQAIHPDVNRRYKRVEDMIADLKKSCWTLWALKKS